MRKKIIIAIALVLIAFGAYRGTMAIFHDETKINSPINAGKLGIEIVNSSLPDGTGVVSFENIMPGARVEDKVSIRNVKDKDLYVRITLTRYWTKDGKKVTDANPTYIQPITKDNRNWIIMNDEGFSNDEIIYFYYKMPLSAGLETNKMIDEILFDSSISDSKYSSYKACVKLEAEAVQKIGAQDAILSQWGIEASFDNDGNIIKIVE